uniref:Uncharacterized protein n=1 Tax=Arundo donax TaxID=35708 RepID=A0A0A9F419_ARUDO
MNKLKKNYSFKPISWKYSGEDFSH